LLPSQEPVFKANVKKCEALGVDIRYGHIATKLEKDTSGRITGVIVREGNTSKYTRFTASKGVILATGDNAGDEKILKHFNPALFVTNTPRMPLGVDVEDNPLNTGDGLRLCAWAGAKVQNYHAPMSHNMGGGFGITPFLALNKSGKRFMNEDIPGQQIQDQIELQQDYAAYQVFDSKWKDQLQYFPPNHGSKCYYRPVANQNNGGDLVMTDADFAAGLVVQPPSMFNPNGGASILSAASLEDLLAQLPGIDITAARQSITRYNDLVDGGKDLDFNKKASRMFKIDTGPF
jgi:hypothetical protein